MRCFIGIPLDHSFQSLIFNTYGLFQDTFNHIRWTPQDNLHITLHFFGETDNALAQETIHAFQDTFSSVKSFQIETKGLIFFPNKETPTVVALSVQPTKKIEALYQKIFVCKKELQKQYPLFIPHITIGRIKKGTTIEPFQFPSFKTTIQTVSWMESVPSQKGTFYRIKHLWELASSSENDTSL